MRVIYMLKPSDKVSLGLMTKLPGCNVSEHWASLVKDGVTCPTIFSELSPPNVLIVVRLMLTTTLSHVEWVGGPVRT
jgi:hypothetical protein